MHIRYEKLKTPFDEGLVWLALDQLKKENLIENEVVIPDQFEGMSRRQIIKKIGFGSLIALPIVASLVAPSGAMAASCNNVLGACPTVTNPSPFCCPGAMACVNTTGAGPNQCCTTTTGVNIPSTPPFPVTVPNAAGNVCSPTTPGGPFNNPANPNNTFCSPLCCNATGIITACTPNGAGNPDSITCRCG
ncbi:MAG: hypothetical protein K1X72_20080 [Pyrinomonadaceae bacterium]|nr:hypothetical protein [Pyrinomonadaceae bacterium]